MGRRFIFILQIQNCQTNQLGYARSGAFQDAFDVEQFVGILAQ